MRIRKDRYRKVKSKAILYDVILKQRNELRIKNAELEKRIYMLKLDFEIVAELHKEDLEKERKKRLNCTCAQ